MSSPSAPLAGEFRSKSMSRKKTILVFSGNNQRAVVAFLRVAIPRGADVAIVAAGPDDPILSTAYRQFVTHVRSNRDLVAAHIIDLVEEICVARGCDRVVALPSTEFLNRFLLRNRALLADARLDVPLVDAALYEQISDKERFGALCRRHGLRVPRDLPWAKSAPPPLVAKPRRYFTGDNQPLAKPHILRSGQEVANFCQRMDAEEWYLQEFVTGRSFYLLYWISNEHRHVAFSQENLVQQSGGRSIVAARAASLHREEIGAEYLRMFDREGFRGLVMVEVRADDGRPSMIEANPRLWGPSQLFVDARVPIFERFLEEHGLVGISGEVSDPVNDARYYWSGGLKGDRPDFHGLSSASWSELEPQFRPTDIYNRDDTIAIWRQENE